MKYCYFKYDPRNKEITFYLNLGDFHSDIQLEQIGDDDTDEDDEICFPMYDQITSVQETTFRCISFQHVSFFICYSTINPTEVLAERMLKRVNDEIG